MSYLSKFTITCVFFSLITFSVILGVYQFFFFEKDEFYINTKIVLKFNNEIPKILFIKETPTFIQNYDYFLFFEFKPHEVLARFSTELEFWKLTNVNKKKSTNVCSLFNETTKNTQFSITDDKKQIILIKFSNINEDQSNECINQLKSLIKTVDEDIKRNILNELNLQENYLLNNNSAIRENQIYYSKKNSEYKEQIKKYSILNNIQILHSKELRISNTIKFSTLILFFCLSFVLALILLLQGKKNRILLYDQVRKLF
jgi:hypothetical protein